MMPAQAMPTLWDLGMCPSSYPEVNVFSGSQNSPPMEESFKDTILKALFSILISHFLAPFFQLLPSCGFFLLCHQYFLHLLFSSKSSCSFFPFLGVQLEVFLLLFLLQALCAWVVEWVGCQCLMDTGQCRSEHCCFRQDHSKFLSFHLMGCTLHCIPRFVNVMLH